MTGFGKFDPLEDFTWPWWMLGVKSDESGKNGKLY